MRCLPVFEIIIQFGYYLITLKSSFTVPDGSLAKCAVHWPIANPSIVAAIMVASDTFDTWAFSWMNLSKYSDSDLMSCWLQFKWSLVVFVPNWYP